MPRSTGRGEGMLRTAYCSRACGAAVALRDRAITISRPLDTSARVQRPLTRSRFLRRHFRATQRSRHSHFPKPEQRCCGMSAATAFGGTFNGIPIVCASIRRPAHRCEQRRGRRKRHRFSLSSLLQGSSNRQRSAARSRRDDVRSSAICLRYDLAGDDRQEVDHVPRNGSRAVFARPGDRHHPCRRARSRLFRPCSCQCRENVTTATSIKGIGNCSPCINASHQGKCASFVERMRGRDYLCGRSALSRRRRPSEVSPCHAFLPRFPQRRFSRLLPLRPPLSPAATAATCRRRSPASPAISTR